MAPDLDVMPVLASLGELLSGLQPEPMLGVGLGFFQPDRDLRRNSGVVVPSARKTVARDVQDYMAKERKKCYPFRERLNLTSLEKRG